MKSVGVLLLFVFFFVDNLVYSQEPGSQFYFSINLGLQGAQIDGDYYSGYNKAGFFGGAFVTKNLSQKTSFSFGLAYSQKGARQNPDPENGNYDYYLARLQYLEVPLQLNHEFKKFTFNWGAYYGRLIKSDEENQYGFVNNNLIFNSNDYGYVLGIEYKLFEKGILGVRHSYSVLPVRDYFFNDNVGYTFFLQQIFNRGLYNNTLMFYFKYLIHPNFIKTDKKNN